MPKKFKYYNIRDLLSKYPNAKYYMAIGERSNGKTYSALDYVLENYFTKGEQFAYLRRFNEDIKPKHMKQLFAAHIENHVIAHHSEGRWNTVDYGSGKFIPMMVPTVDLEADILRSTEPCGFAFDLNGMEHYKSISFPKITTIIFDEFLSRQGYLPNEFQLLMNAISTIVRQRTNVKIIMLGNTVNRFCPYFIEMGLNHVKEQKQGTIDLYRYGDSGLEVAVEYCSSSKDRGGKSSDVYFAFDNEQLQMITSGAWEIAVYPTLTNKYRPKDVQFEVFFQFDAQFLHGELVANENEFFMFIHPKTSEIKNPDKDIVYCDHPDQRWNWKTCLSKQGDKLSTTIMRLIRENKVFYANNETGEIMRNYLIWCDSYNIKK